MKSFGIWYRNEEDSQIEPNIDLHINLWNISKKNIGKDIEPFIDFGIIIQNFRSIKELKLFFPFYFEDEGVQDLFDKVRDNNIARMIFNDNNCNTSSKGTYHYIKDTEDQKEKLIFKLKNQNSFDQGVWLEDIEGTKCKMINICFDRIKKDDDCNDFNHLYMRFRIKSPKLKEMLFCRLNKKNWFLESGFVVTQIVDLKVNKERNISQDLCHDLTVMNKFKFAAFDKVHFLVMNQANDDVEILSNFFAECRKLETEDWNNYLDGEYDTKEVLVYHFKRNLKNENNKKIKEFSQLVKISTHTTNYGVIVAYMFIIVVLGLLSSIICNLIMV